MSVRLRALRTLHGSDYGTVGIGGEFTVSDSLAADLLQTGLVAVVEDKLPEPEKVIMEPKKEKEVTVKLFDNNGKEKKYRTK